MDKGNQLGLQNLQLADKGLVKLPAIPSRRLIDNHIAITHTSHDAVQTPTELRLAVAVNIVKIKTQFIKAQLLGELGHIILGNQGRTLARHTV